MDGAKQWKCERGHVLGMVQRVKVEGYFISRLLLYREAIDLNANGSMGDVDVMAVVEGTVLDVKCSLCEAVRPWYMGRDVIERMMQTYLAE